MRMGRWVAVVVVAVVASGCQFVLQNPGVAASCDALAYELNVGETELGTAREAAIHDAVAEFAGGLGRAVDDQGTTTENWDDNDPGDAILIQLLWSDEAPNHLGYASAHITSGEYDGGYILLNPLIASMPTWLIRRLVLHELGHLHGLGDVTDTGELMNPDLTADAWGPGDIAGLVLTHRGGCG